MKVLVINGSPKLEKSNSLRLTNAFVKGLQSETEVEFEQLDIYKLNIEPCQGCLPAGSVHPASASRTTIWQAA